MIRIMSTIPTQKSAPMQKPPTRFRLLVASLLGGLMLLTGAPAMAQSGAVTAITGGKIFVNPGKPAIEKGTILIANGRIQTVGAADRVAIPANATIIKADGQWITPGIFDAFTRIGVIDIELEDRVNDESAGDAVHNAALYLSLSFNPRSIVIPVTRAEGLTEIAVVPSPGKSLLAGYGFLADLSGSSDSVTRAQAFFVAVMGEEGAAIAGGSRSAAWAYLEAAFSDAERFPAAYAGSGSGDVLRYADAKALAPVLKGSVPFLVKANRASDLQQLIALKKRRPALRLVAVGGAEAWVVAKELAAAKIPVLLDPTQDLPDSFEALAATLENARRLNDAGVTFAIAHATGNDAGFQARLLPQLAGNAVAHGLPWDAALASITRVPAEIFGISDQIGTLSQGKLANLVIWDGDPLEVTSAPTHVLIGGEEKSLESRQSRLAKRYHPLHRDPALPPAYQ